MTRDEALAATSQDRFRSFRHGANAVVKALLDLQDEYGLTDLEMVSVLNEHQRSLLGGLVRDQHKSEPEVTG